MFASRKLLINATKRSFSSSVVNSRLVIVSNILKAQAIRAATTEEELNKAINGKYDVTLDTLPSEAAVFKDYLSSAPVNEKYNPNPNFWHNKPFAEMVVEEAQRAETWPFIVGIVTTFFLVCVIFPRYLPEESRKDSPWIKMKEGRYFDEEFGIVRDEHGKIKKDDHSHSHHH